MYPGTTKAFVYEIRDASTGTLQDADSTSIKIYDPVDVVRVAYDSTNLSRRSLGKYSYSFTLPDDIIEGQWKIDITVTINDLPTRAYYYFPVREA